MERVNTPANISVEAFCAVFHLRNWKKNVSKLDNKYTDVDLGKI